MANPKVVVTILGGVLSHVQLNTEAEAEAVEVYLRDWDDAKALGLDEPELIKVEYELHD